MKKITRTVIALGGGAAVLLLAMRSGASASTTTPAPKKEQGGGGGPTVQQLAVQLAADINARGYDYSRPLCRSFQIAAGFPVKSQDGIYGPATKAELAKYVAAPSALFVGAKKAG